MKYSLVLMLLVASAGIGQGYCLPCGMHHTCSLPENGNAAPDYLMKVDAFLTEPGTTVST